MAVGRVLVFHVFVFLPNVRLEHCRVAGTDIGGENVLSSSLMPRPLGGSVVFELSRY